VGKARERTLSLFWIEAIRSVWRHPERVAAHRVGDDPRTAQVAAAGAPADVVCTVGE
jgi:hypothetical protein